MKYRAAGYLITQLCWQPVLKLFRLILISKCPLFAHICHRESAISYFYCIFSCPTPIIAQPCGWGIQRNPTWLNWHKRSTRNLQQVSFMIFFRGQFFFDLWLFLLQMECHSSLLHVSTDFAVYHHEQRALRCFVDFSDFFYFFARICATWTRISKTVVFCR